MSPEPAQPALPMPPRPVSPRRPRLRAAADLVPPGTTVVADVGSGHGILPRMLLNEGRAERCIATERDPERLTHVRPFPPTHRLARRLDRRSGDGLGPIRPADRVALLTVTGLGGKNLVRLLDRGRSRLAGIRRLVLQPQTEIAGLRRWLFEAGFGLTDERLVVDRGRLYGVIAAEPAAEGARPEHPTLTPDELFEAGPCLVRSTDPLVRRYWEQEQARLERLLALPGSAGPARRRAAERAELARRVLSSLPAPATADAGPV